VRDRWRFRKFLFDAIKVGLYDDAGENQRVVDALNVHRKRAGAERNDNACGDKSRAQQWRRDWCASGPRTIHRQL
jgi:hypothetical protein